MNSFKALRYDTFYTQQRRAFGGPITGTAGAIFLARQHDEWRIMFRIFDCGFVDTHHLAAGLKLRNSTFGVWNHQVFDSDIGESAASHHPVVATPRTVAVEFFERHAVFDQIFSSGRGFLDAARGGD